MNGETVDALAIGAHPDDAEMGAGGTLLRLGALGYRTGILDMTRGEMGTRGTAEVRAEEAREAARALGLSFRDTADLGDGFVRDTEDARRALVRIFRRLRPKLVFTHYWEEPHPDHVATSQLVRHVSYLSGLAKYDAEVELALWSAVRSLNERAATFESLALDARTRQDSGSASEFDQRAREAFEQARLAYHFMQGLTSHR